MLGTDPCVPRNQLRLAVLRHFVPIRWKLQQHRSDFALSFNWFNTDLFYCFFNSNALDVPCLWVAKDKGSKSGRVYQSHRYRWRVGINGTATKSENLKDESLSNHRISPKRSSSEQHGVTINRLAKLGLGTSRNRLSRITRRERTKG